MQDPEDRKKNQDNQYNGLRLDAEPEKNAPLYDQI
jgi:hypothetical protein